MISFLETRYIFEHRCCIQHRTSYSSSTSVSFHPPPSSLNLFSFMNVAFSSFWIHSQTFFLSTLNFCCTMDRIFLRMFNSGLFELHTISLASFSFVGYCLIFTVIHHTNQQQRYVCKDETEILFLFWKVNWNSNDVL